jgi:hypothetical protein
VREIAFSVFLRFVSGALPRRQAVQIILLVGAMAAVEFCLALPDGPQRFMISRTLALTRSRDRYKEERQRPGLTSSWYHNIGMSLNGERSCTEYGLRRNCRRALNLVDDSMRRMPQRFAEGFDRKWQRRR